MAERLPVQHAVDERAQQRRTMLPVGVIEEYARTRNRPLRQDLYKAALLEQFADLIHLEVVGNTEPVDRCRHADVRMVGDDRPIDSDLVPLAALLELPPVVPPIHLESPVDARVVLQVAWRLGRAVAGQVVRRSN